MVKVVVRVVVVDPRVAVGVVAVMERVRTLPPQVPGSATQMGRDRLERPNARGSISDGMEDGSLAELKAWGTAG